MTIERLDSQLMAIAQAKRDEILNNCANGADDDLPVEERPSRAEASPGCLLKFADDVMVSGILVRYLCPGRGIGWFYGMYIEDNLIQTSQYEPQYVTDRAPADPLETPMPIFPETP